ncbi:hypothetical protein HSX37_16165|uniref:Uncharacterized protein n=1 Tax=Dendrosporobacter quercicolus TaxID=146817 RepID=A0A1G9ZRA4_9FIRM|nr:hypothetical protein [Dendrosporobacter quercicolus]NSL49571.1 hypothetical protein [Dendrosporobacter quercicolus DSM 1736]SDN23153.1 hypothetical protein SAMN04488502_11526 [Dendrosporobacter quercicolus]
MAKIKLTISAESAQAIKALQDVAKAAGQTGKDVKSAGSGANFSEATKSAGSFLGTLGKISVVGAAILYIFNQVKDAATALLGPGFEFNKSMEQNKLGLAGILQSMTFIGGKAVDFYTALSVSSDMMKKLQRDALRTAASTEDLVEVFRAILAPGLNANMLMDQIRQIAVVGTNAVKSLGVPRQQIVQELRDLVQGGITAAGSTLATALGITDADIKKAKNSAGGLYKYLMDRMAGFAETANKFPDTMAGKIDQLNEMWTMASAKFAEEFEEPIKEGLQFLSDLIGTINEETGELEINPAILAFMDDVQDGFKEVKELSSDIKNLFGNSFDPMASSAKNLYSAIKDVGSILTDLTRILTKVSVPGFELFGKVLDNEIKKLQWFTDKAKTLFDYLAQITGTKQPEPEKGWADFRRLEDTNNLPPITPAGNVTNKNADQNKLIENSQQALKIALAAIEADAKKAVTAIKQEQDQLKVAYEQALISAEEYMRRKTEMEMKEQQIAVDQAQRKLEATQGALFDKDEDQNTAVSKADNELDIEIEKLKTFGVSLDDVNKAINAMSAAGQTWRKELENVNIDGLQDNAKTAIDALGAYFYKLTGQQMVVSSGLRDWGGHVNGTKFDVVDAGASELLEKNINGIRDKIIAYAESIGLQVLDEYDNPSEHATGGHLDINAKDFTATMAAQVKAKIGTVLTKSGLEYLNAILTLMGEADEISKSLAEAKGDVSTRQKAELTAKYNDLIKKFEVNGMADAVKDIQDLQKMQFAQIDFSQAQKDLEIANEEMTTAQIDLLNSLATGAMSATEVSDEYVRQYNAKTRVILADLRLQLDSAVKLGDRDLANKIRAAIRGITDKISEFFDAVIARIDAELQNEIAMIDADRSLTSMQKSDAIDAANRRAAADKAVEYETKAQKIRDSGGNIGDAIDYENAATLNRKLAEIPTLLEKIHESSKRAFEDGLLTFLTDGINQCASLGDAILDLANTVLSAIQRVYAEALTKNIMSLMGLGPNRVFTLPTQNVTASTQNFAEGGSIDSGIVEGPGTSVSDSILAWVDNVGRFIRISNGEFVMRGTAVTKYGRDLLERLNSGQVPTGMLKAYAGGGSLTNRSFAGTDAPGPQSVAANLTAGDTTVNLRNVNVFDRDEIIGGYMRGRSGERVLMNFVKNNAATVNHMLKMRG